MKKFKNYKLIFEIFCIIYFILAIIIGSTISTQFNTPVPPAEFLKSFVIPWVIIPLIIVFVLAYYENIFAGILLLGYEVIIAISYFNSNGYVNIIDHLNERFLLFVFIPISVGIIYLYGYFRYKKTKK